MRNRVLVALFACLLSVAVLVFAGGCASTDTGQGQAEQGGTVGPSPQWAVGQIVLGNMIFTSSPAAAPSANSGADARSAATNPTTVAIDPEAAAKALEALGLPPGVREQIDALIAARDAKDKPKVLGGEPAPAETPTPAPAEGGSAQ